MTTDLRDLLVVAVATGLAMAVSAVRGRGASDGVNVVGYFGAAAGLGERVRELAACLEAADVPVTRWDVTAGAMPRGRLRRVTIAVVTAVQLESVRHRVPEVFERPTIGYFFWELETVPDEQQWGIGLVDEIWAPTEFVRSAYSAATTRPVRLVPLPIADPGPVERRRTADAFTFLVSFDHRSVMERKNPIGAVQAFRRAFPDGRARLVVKTMNAVEQPAAAAQLRAAIGADERITIVDDCLSRDEHVGLLASVDALVSLHRSEGLGLHLAEAMWLGVPVIATGYSGNLDFMDESCAVLVDHSLVPVEFGGGAYDGEAVWAEPDVDQAAEAMRVLLANPERCCDLAAAGRRRMERQPDRATAGRAMAALLEGPLSAGNGARDTPTRRWRRGRGPLATRATTSTVEDR